MTIDRKDLTLCQVSGKHLINGAHDEGDNNNSKGPVPSQAHHTGSVDPHTC